MPCLNFLWDQCLAVLQVLPFTPFLVYLFPFSSSMNVHGYELHELMYCSVFCFVCLLSFSFWIHGNTKKKKKKKKNLLKSTQNKIFFLDFIDKTTSSKGISLWTNLKMCKSFNTSLYLRGHMSPNSQQSILFTEWSAVVWREGLLQCLSPELFTSCEIGLPIMSTCLLHSKQRFGPGSVTSKKCALAWFIVVWSPSIFPGDISFFSLSN